VKSDKLIFRPAVYGIITKYKKILLVKVRRTGKYFFPGGAVELGEKNKNALRREVKEETGIDVDVKSLMKVQENFFYYDPEDWASHNFSFFYFCKPKTTNLIEDEKVEDLEAEKPRWVKIDSLKKNDFQGFAWKIFKKAVKIS